MKRRKFVVLAGSTTAITLAGCLHGGDDGPESVVQSFLESLGSEEATKYLHSASKFDTSADELNDFWLDLSVERSELASEKLGQDRIQTKLDNFNSSYTGETVSDLSDSENALVEVAVKNTKDDNDSLVPLEVLTAKEEGDWKVVDIVGF